MLKQNIIQSQILVLQVITYPVLYCMILSNSEYTIKVRNCNEMASK